MAKLNPKKKYAIIQNNRIHSLFMGAELPEYNEKDLLVIEATNDYRLGDTYENGKVIATEKTPTLDEVKAEKRKELTAKLSDGMFSSTATFKGHKFQMNDDSYTRLTSVAALASLNNQLPPDFFWVSEDNKRVSMSLEELKEFSKIFVTHYWEVFRSHQDQREKLNSAKSIKEVTQLGL